MVRLKSLILLGGLFATAIVAQPYGSQFQAQDDPSYYKLLGRYTPTGSTYIGQASVYWHHKSTMIGYPKYVHGLDLVLVWDQEQQDQQHGGLFWQMLGIYRADCHEHKGAFHLNLSFGKPSSPTAGAPVVYQWPYGQEPVTEITENDKSLGEQAYKLACSFPDN